MQFICEFFKLIASLQNFFQYIYWKKSTHKWISLNPCCCSKVNYIPQFCNHVLIFHFLNYSRIEMAEITQPCKVLLIFMTQKTHILPISFRIVGENMCFLQPKSVMGSWFHLNHSNSTNSPRKIFLLSWDRSPHDVCNSQDTTTLYVLVFCLCVLSHLINGKALYGRAKVTHLCILCQRSDLVVVKCLPYSMNDEVTSLIPCVMDWMFVSSPNAYLEILTPTVMVLGE